MRDAIEFFWRNKARRLVLTDVFPRQKLVLGRDPATGKHWHCEYEYVTNVIAKAEQGEPDA
jgi:hypothetical protein